MAGLRVCVSAVRGGQCRDGERGNTWVLLLLVGKNAELGLAFSCTG